MVLRGRSKLPQKPEKYSLVAGMVVARNFRSRELFRVQASCRRRRKTMVDLHPLVSDAIPVPARSLNVTSNSGPHRNILLWRPDTYGRPRWKERHSWSRRRQTFVY